MRNVYRVSTKQHGDMKLSILLSKKRNHFASSVCQCTVLLECGKFQIFPQTRKCDHFACFCGCNCKTSRICHQRTRFFTIGAG